jgi:hypothetical protein
MNQTQAHVVLTNAQSIQLLLDTNGRDCVPKMIDCVHEMETVLYECIRADSAVIQSLRILKIMGKTLERGDDFCTLQQVVLLACGTLTEIANSANQ